MSLKNNFRLKSENVVRDFLHTVVAVDDNMAFGINNDTYPTEEDELIEPDNDYIIPTQDNTRKVLTSKAETKIRNHAFNYLDLAESFASFGIVCSGLLARQFDDEEKNNIIKSSSKADITILDWDMCNDAGVFASKIIESMINKDIENGGRLRLLSIYTGENPQVVSSTLNKFLEKKFGETLLLDDKIKIKNRMELKHWLICIISKNVVEKELPNVLISHFTDLTSGLLSNAALSCISEVRGKTHSILSKYNNGLDTAYASHILSLIAATSSRDYAHEAAQDYAVDLISEEIRASLQTSENLKDTLSKETISLWPSYHREINNNASFYINRNSPVEIGQDNIKEIFSASTEDELADAIQKNNIPNSKPFYLSIGQENDIKILNLCALELSRRSLRHNSSLKSVSLKQGTIIKGENNDIYLCIQPLCDSVRLKDKSSFIFIKGQIDEIHYNLILDDSNEDYIKIKIKPTTSNIERIEFSVNNEKGMIIGERDNGIIIFHSTFNVVKSSNDELENKTFKYEWLGELKTGFAQRMISEVSHNLSRIGLDQHEWMRLKLKQNKDK